MFKKTAFLATVILKVQSYNFFFNNNIHYLCIVIEYIYTCRKNGNT